MSERIMTQHPEGKAGVNISRAKYDTIKRMILDILAESGKVSFKALPDLVSERLGDSFEGSIPWYVTSVKLDLEARGLVERVPGRTPQVLRLATE